VSIGLVAGLLAVACRSAPGSFQGRVVEVSGRAVGGLWVVATPDRATEGCSPLEATTTPDGALTFERTCPGVTYTLATKDSPWRFMSAPPVVGGTMPTEETRLYVRSATTPTP
jgi:hypothetical protein